MLIRVSAGWALFYITLPMSVQWDSFISVAWMMVMIAIPYCILTNERFDEIVLQCVMSDGSKKLHDAFQRVIESSKELARANNRIIKEIEHDQAQKDERAC